MASRFSQGKTFGFGLSAFKKFPELIPLVSVVTVALTGCASFCMYSLMSKPDVKILRGNGKIKTEWEAVSPTDMRKLIIINPDRYRPIKEVEDLKRDIGSYKR